MRQVTVGGKTFPITASTMGIFYHNREFSTDTKEADVFQDAAQLVAEARVGFAASSIVRARLLWTMARSAQHGQPFPDFLSWMADTDLNLMDSDLWGAVVEEVSAGFFRAKGTPAPQDKDGIDPA